MRQRIGSILYTVFLFLSVVIYAPVVLLTAPLPADWTYRAVQWWCQAQMAMLRALCRLDYRIEGFEHLPDTPSIVLMKHSSAWETIAQLLFLPRQCWVLKRELMWAPFFGWALALLKPIAIDRRGGRAAVEQVIARGRERLDEGLWVVIFPEGTRVAFGETGRFGLSGTLLAQATGKPIVPIAHDAGRYWPRRGVLKQPGTVRVKIGAPIETQGRDPREVTAEVRAWIQTAVNEIVDGGEPVDAAIRRGSTPPTRFAR